MENRFWRIKSRPEGNNFADAFELVEASLDEPGEGQIVVRNSLISMDAGTRMWLTDRTDGYQPPLEDGTPMTGLGVGHVVQSRHADFSEGDLVL
ncbi:MAG TPA: NADP-dependent oxidoreductase, partial [Erythrobacter sp.]|nr:NADP-dependent oxidoreductase [Erythrobacter sp.]